MRAQYAMRHFWDAFLSTEATYFCDSMTVNGVGAAELEAQFANYATLLTHADIRQACESAESLFGHVETLQKADASSNVYERFGDLMKKYFYDPNSPYREEDIYGAYLRCLAASDMTPDSLKDAYAYDAQMCALNAIGTPAADFSFLDIKGRRHTLYGIKAEYTLLFFSNPGCEACKDIIQVLEGNPLIKDMVARGRLAVVNIYIDDDIEAWKSYQDHYPSTWYSGYDDKYAIRMEVRYNVRAIPSLYLLDSSKTVLMKDAPEERVMSFLGQMSGNIAG